MAQAEHGRRAPGLARTGPDQLPLADRDCFAGEVSANEKNGPRSEANENGAQQRQHEWIVYWRPVAVVGRIGEFFHEPRIRNCLN